MHHPQILSILAQKGQKHLKSLVGNLADMGDPGQLILWEPVFLSVKWERRPTALELCEKMCVKYLVRWKVSLPPCHIPSTGSKKNQRFPPPNKPNSSPGEGTPSPTLRTGLGAATRSGSTRGRSLPSRRALTALFLSRGNTSSPRGKSHGIMRDTSQSLKLF